MRNRNKEMQVEAGFDYDDFDEEQALKDGRVEVYEDPYEDYDVYDVVITEIVKKKVAVYAKDAKSAQEWVEGSLLDEMDMEHDVEEVKRTAEGMEEVGSTSYDVTVPLWWYEEGDE